MKKIFQLIAGELSVQVKQVEAAVGLLDEGATVPFISRYRKEVTGSLDDTQLRQLEERLRYLRELEERRAAIIASIDEQGKMTPELRGAIDSATTKNVLEDLYLPYKQKRRTKGQIAMEAGLLPLADSLLENPAQDPQHIAQQFVDAEKGVADIKAALDGAKYILMERFAEDAALIATLRNYLQQEASVICALVEGKEQEGAKFRDYFEYDEAWAKVPSHRALAVFRGRNEGILQLRVDIAGLEGKGHPCEGMVAGHFGIKHQGRLADDWLQEVVRWTWKVKLHTHLESDLLAQLREKAEEEAIRVFAANLKDLLLAAPAGPKAVIGLDPGLRTGVKVAVVDHTGKYLDHTTIFPTPPQNRTAEATAVVVRLAQKYQVELVAIGNGTASRETDRFVSDIITHYPQLGLRKVIVNEAGASVYSASEFAAREFPDLDVTIRGAISIARRLQDPLAELVKIEPKSIGVGQYQHDVSQTQLARSLDAVVEDCVNAVGVDVNTASVALLSRVSGLGARSAENIVSFRNEHGVFRSREQLRKVPRLGDKTYEQSAGFLRIMNGENVLDRSAVHPESYPVVEAIAAKSGRPLREVVGDVAFLKTVDAKLFVTPQCGLPTITDIIEELKKPGRDPRPEFRTADFREGVEKISDLVPGMVLEGVVTNVANFGAFVDIGVHQDGLVHISALSHQFVKDPRTVVKAGDVVRVKVMEVDVQRQRIALSMRMDDEPGREAPGKKQASPAARRETRPQASPPQPSGAFAAAFANAKRKEL
jgi:uncharacterized protein